MAPAARQRNAWVLIKVRDHGTGVAHDALDKLTKPFYRGDAARTAATCSAVTAEAVFPHEDRS